MDQSVRHILYTTDLGPRSLEVLRHAIGFAQALQARLHLVTVATPSEHRGSMLSVFVPEKPVAGGLGSERIRSTLEGRLEAFATANPDFDPRTVLESIQVLEGDPAELILREAERIPVDLIVLGSHGHTPIGEMLLGSVAHKVTIKARVPVLLVPINQ